MLTLIQSTYFRDLLESFSNAVVVFNTEGLAYAANTAALGLVGLDWEACRGKGWWELFPGMAKEAEFNQLMENAVDSGVCPLPLDTPYALPDGRKRHLSLSTSLLTENGKVFGVFLAMADVTHIHMLHEREKAILRELSAQQQQRLEGLLLLSQNMVHQIRNPITAMAGFIRLAMHKAQADSPQAGYLENVMDGCLRLETIVRAFSEYAALRRQNNDRADMADIARRAGELARLRVPELGKDVDWDLGLEPCPLRGDADMLIEAGAEILVNSLEALEGRGGTVAVRTYPRDGSCVLEVADTGPGVSQANLNHVCDPFFTTKAVGVGMGLSKAERSAREHGGGLEIESPADGGLRVRLRVPEERK